MATSDGPSGPAARVASRESETDLKDIVREMGQHLGDDEFLRVSLVLCKIVQNAIAMGGEQAVYRSVRLCAPVLSIAGAIDVLLIGGFQRDEAGTHLSLSEPIPVKQLEATKQALLSARRRYDVIEGLEVPVVSLKLAERLGKGKFGEVYNGFWDKRAVAIKTLRPKCDQLAIDEFHREAKIMRSLNHSNVVSLLAVALTVEPAYLVLELMRGCFLNSLRAQAASTPGEQLEYAFQVAAGMDYLHQRGVLHCDLAARNILINSDGVLKISDFGLARLVGSPECHVSGKPAKFATRWTAPEVLFDGLLSKAADVWSFGIMFYEFVTSGAVPYGDLTNPQTKLHVGNGYRLPQAQDCPDEFHSLMLKCWAKVPGSRPGFPAIVSDLAKDRQKFVGGMMRIRRAVAIDDGRARSSSPGSGSSASSVDSYNTANWTDSPISGHCNTPPSQSPSPQLRQNPKDKPHRTGKLKKLTFGRASADNLLKGESVVTVFTVLVSPLQPSVSLPLKSKHRSTELVAMVLKQLGKSSSDSSQYALVELKPATAATSSSGEASAPPADGEAERVSFQSRFVHDSERPLSLRATWASPSACHLVLCSAHGRNDNSILTAINEHFAVVENTSVLHQQCQGYLLKFQESHAGTRVAGRSKSENWQRFWARVDGNAMLLYRDEETEENQEEPITHIQLQQCTAEQAVDVSKKRDMLRISTLTGDSILLRTSGKDIYRWLEAVTTAATAHPSSILEKFGDGELLHTGYLLIDDTQTPTTPTLFNSNASSRSTSSRGSVASGTSSDQQRHHQRGRSTASELSVGLLNIQGLSTTHRRLLCALKGRQLLAFVGETRRELIDFANVVAISVLNPTSMLDFSMSRSSEHGSSEQLGSDGGEDDCLMTFGVQVDVVRPRSGVKNISNTSTADGTVRYFLKPDTPGDLDAWTDAFDRLLLKIGKSDLMVPVNSVTEDNEKGEDDVDGGVSDYPRAAVSATSTLGGAQTMGDLPEIVEVPCSPIAEEFTRAHSTTSGSSKDVGTATAVRRSIRRRQETGFQPVAKLRKTSLHLDERSVYDLGDDASAATAAAAVPPRKAKSASAMKDESILSPVKETKSNGASPARLLCSSDQSAASAVAEHELQTDNAANLGGRPSVEAVSEAHSPAKPSPKHRDRQSPSHAVSKPSDVESAGEYVNASATSLVQHHSDTTNSEGHRSPSPRHSPARKPVPSPRTLRRNRDKAMTKSESSLVHSASSALAPSTSTSILAGTTASTPANSSASNSQDSRSTDVTLPPPQATHNADSPRPAPSKRAPPPISPKPSRRHMVNLPVSEPISRGGAVTESSSRTTAVHSISPPVPRKTPSEDAKPAVKSDQANHTQPGSATATQASVQESDDTVKTVRSPARSAVLSTSPSVPEGLVSPEHARPATTHMQRSKSEDFFKPSDTGLMAAVEENIALKITPSSPPPLPPDSAYSPQHQSEPASLANSPPPLPQKASRSHSSHSILSATLPRQLSRGGSLDMGVSHLPVACVSTENVSSPQPPTLPPKNPASRRGSRDHLNRSTTSVSTTSLSRSAGGSTEVLSQSSSSPFFTPHSGAESGGLKRPQVPASHDQHARQVSSPATLLHRSPVHHTRSATAAAVLEPSTETKAASAAEEYIEMAPGAALSTASPTEDYIDMSDQSVRSDPFLERQHSPLKHCGSHSTASSSSLPGEDYIPMSPLDAPGMLAMPSPSLSSSRSPLTPRPSLDSSVALADDDGPDEYVEMADDPVAMATMGARQRSTSAALRPHANSVASALGRRGKPAVYSEIPQDEDDGTGGPGSAAAGKLARPPPYACIDDDDSAPPPLPSRPPGNSRSKSHSSTLLSHILPGGGDARRSSTPQTETSGAMRARTESVPATGNSLFHGKRSIAVANSSRSSSSTAAHRGSVQQQSQAPTRTRAATVSVSSTDGGEAASATVSRDKAKSKKKGKEKDKEKEKESRFFPAQWKMVVDVHGGEYFYEEATGRTSWNYEGMIMLYEKSQQPAVPPPRGKKNTDPGSGWKAAHNQDGRTYYFHKKKKLSTWIIEDTW
eukprot:scpid7703/ scgid21849/ Tyrosine-protein kinase isoform SRK1